MLIVEMITYKDNTPFCISRIFSELRMSIVEEQHCIMYVGT